MGLYGFLDMALQLLASMPMRDHLVFRVVQLIRVLIFIGIFYGVRGNVQNDS